MDQVTIQIVIVNLIINVLSVVTPIGFMLMKINRELERYKTKIEHLEESIRNLKT
jgi:hypothetical protein